MSDVESLASILSGSTGEAAEAPETPAEATATEPAPTPAQAAEAPAAPSRDEQGRFAPKAVEAPKAEAAKDDKPAITPRDIAGLIDERKKRQAAEARLAELERAKPKTDIFENPDAAVSERVQEQIAPIMGEVFALKLELAKTRMPDFDEVAVEFLKAAQADPSLQHQADTAPDPLAFIYREGKRLKELGPYGGDLGKYRDAVVAEQKKANEELTTRLKAMEAELATLKGQQAALAAVPKSLNSAPAGAGPSSLADTDETDISKIVRFNNHR